MSEPAIDLAPPQLEAALAEHDLALAPPSFQEPRQLPRISIHAFCVSPETGIVLQRAADDRRAARAHVTVMMGGVESAVGHYGDKPTPNLILVETRGARATVLKELSALAEFCDPGTKVIVLGAVNDIPLYRELIRRGISEYLVGPFAPVQIIDTIALLYGDPDQAPVGRIMAFIGARGGTGSSTVAHNVAWALAEEFEDEAMIIDFDLAFGTTGLNFNQEHGQGLLEAVTAPERLDSMLLERLLIHCSDRLSLFTAPATLERDMELNPEICDAVLDVACGAVPNIIVDLPHLWTPWSRQVLQRADDIVITATPELASLRNAKNLVDLLKAARPNDAPARLVINQLGMGKRPEIPLKDFAEAIGIEPALVLPFDPLLFGTAANNGQMLGELKERNKPAQGLAQLAAVLTGRHAAPQKKRKAKSILSFFSEKKA